MESPVIIPMRDIIYPMDRSMPPEIITKASPTPAMMVKEDWIKIFRILYKVKNVLVFKLKNRASASKTIGIAYFFATVMRR